METEALLLVRLSLGLCVLALALAVIHFWPLLGEVVLWLH